MNLLAIHFILSCDLRQKARDQLGPAPDSQLDEDVAQMKFDGLLADEELLAYLGIGEALGTGECNLRFPAAQGETIQHALKRTPETWEGGVAV
jgi:hypothetical protein